MRIFQPQKPRLFSFKFDESNIFRSFFISFIDKSKNSPIYYLPNAVHESTRRTFHSESRVSVRDICHNLLLYFSSANYSARRRQVEEQKCTARSIAPPCQEFVSTPVHFVLHSMKEKKISGKFPFSAKIWRLPLLGLQKSSARWGKVLTILQHALEMTRDFSRQDAAPTARFLRICLTEFSRELVRMPGTSIYCGN